MLRPRIIAFVGWLIAITTLIVLCVYVFLFGDSLSKDWSRKNFVSLLRDWQTQAAAGFAVAAALLAGASVLYQTAVSFSIEEKRRERRLNALLAAFSYDLSIVIEWASENAKNCETAISNLTQPRTPITLAPPKFPKDFVTIAISVVESSDDDLVLPVRTLLRNIQIMNSRMKDMYTALEFPSSKMILRFNLVGYITDFCDVYARCERLIAHARQPGHGAKLTIDSCDVHRALFLLGISGQVQADVDATIKSRVKAGHQNADWPES